MCNDCIHFEVCAPVMRNDIYIRKHMLAEKSPKCKYFLDKSLCVELPCAFGDTVYEVVFLKEKAGFIVKRKIVGFHTGELPKLRGKKREEYLIVYHEATHCISHLNYEKIGKTVFLTREAAELASVNAATAIAVKHDYRQIKIGTDTEVTIDLEEVKEKLAIKLNPFTAYLKEVGG